MPRALLVAPSAVLLILCSLACTAQTEMRGVWMHATQIETRSDADRCIATIDSANLNAVFLLVWYWGGQAFYHSQLCPMGEGVEEGHDPLGYMIEECHKRGVEVHAWYVNGAYGASEPRHVLDEHPDWAVDTGGGGELWYDFGKPEVREFQSDLMIECLQNYDVDGLLFDYIRYGPRMCYCEHCRQEFAQRYGYEPLTEARLKTFPVAATLSANALGEPTTATVLAEFSNGLPAIAINEVGKGKVLLLNWHAENELPPPAAETLQRVLTKWDAADNEVVVMDTAPNRARYGRGFTLRAVELFQKFGYKARAIREHGLPKLLEDTTRNSTLVLCAMYLIPDDIGNQIEEFVKAGGTLVVIDGPAFSSFLPRVLGMGKHAGYFNEAIVISATGHSDLVPSSDREIDMEKEKSRAEKWIEFRKWGVTELVRDVYERAKAIKPQVQVTAAVFTPIASAQSVFQDWPGWLREGIIDYIFPMAYTANNDDLVTQIEEWKTIDPSLERIVPFLSIYQKGPAGAITRDIDLILSQQQLCADKGAHGAGYFALHYLSEPLIEAFREGPYSGKIEAYRPPTRNAK